MLRRFAVLGFSAVLFMGVAGLAAATPSSPDAKVFFVDLKDGDTVTSPVTVHFGISGMALAPAGTETPGTGHHHLLIDTTLTGDALKQPIPMDEHHLHFGKAQTEAVVTLSPGKHTLQLVLGDWSHVPHDPPVLSAPITVTVK